MLQKDRYLYKGYRGFQSLQLPGSKTVSKTKIHTSKANRLSCNWKTDIRINYKVIFVNTLYKVINNVTFQNVETK